MIIKWHGDSRDAQLIAKDLCHHYELSIYAQTYAQDINRKSMVGRMDNNDTNKTFVWSLVRFSSGVFKRIGYQQKHKTTIKLT